MSFRILLATDQGRVERTHPSATLRIGRGAGLDLRFDDPAIALEHAVLRHDESGLWLSDLGSSSGTYVNAQPIDTSRLKVGDRIEIGNFRIDVLAAETSEWIEISVVEQIDNVAPAPSEAIDWASALSLRGGLLNKGFVSLMLSALAVLVMLLLPAFGRHGAYQPGELSTPHRFLGTNCASCHRPWRGAPSSACASCHPATDPMVSNAPTSAGTQPRARATPAASHHADLRVGKLECAVCHQEHLGLEALQSTGNIGCSDCHADLRLAGGAVAIYARSITSFAVDHPEFTVTLEGDGEPRRIAIGSSELGIADPGSIAFSHRGHLESRLIAANEAWDSLTCGDCHQAQDDDLLAVRFDLHCQRCHALSFDDRFPDLVAVHEEPEALRGFLLRTYQDRASRPPPRRSSGLGPILLNAQRGASELGISAARNLAATYAEADLYEEKCITCHGMNLDQVFDGGDAPAVERTGWPGRYQIHARFAHGPHIEPDLGLGDGGTRDATCLGCHSGIDTSTSSDQLHLPGIDSCTGCHGGSERSARSSSANGPQATTMTTASDACATCHRYHGIGSEVRISREKESG